MPKPVSSKCSVCRHPQREAIDTALLRGGTLRGVARSFGFPTHDSVSRHQGHVRGLGETRTQVTNSRRREKRASTPEKLLEKIDSINSPADVMRELEVLYAESRALLDEAKRMRDWRLADKAIGSAAVTLDKIAKAHGVYASDGAVTIDQRTQNVELALGTMSEADLRNLISLASSSGSQKALAVTHDG